MRRANETLAPLGVAVLAFAAFWPVVRYPFMSLDDDLYVTGNAIVQRGLTLGGAHWAFTSFHAGNYYPLTLLSHMLDVTLFGARPGLHHLTSLLLHAASALLLFSALRAMTGDRWRSAAVAAVFAIHPLQVESVAWIAERKNVLCGLFVMLALRAYASYARRPSAVPYIGVTLAFAAALLSKPAAVSLPIILLLLDVWPLEREGRTPWTRLLGEKLPWFFLSAASCAVSLAAARPKALVALPPAVRFANAALSLGKYLRHFAWPSGLACFYPHPGAHLSYTAALLCAAALAAAFAFCARERGRRPWLAVGFLWFVAFLLPALGLVQVGRQAMADRYAYLALVGPALALAWSFPKRWERNQAAILCAAGCVVALLLACTLQLRYWGDSLTLARRAVEAGGDSAFTRTNLAYELLLRGRVDEGVENARAAVAFDPDDPRALNDLGRGLLLQGHYEEAEQALSRALEREPADDAILVNLANAKARLRAAPR